MIENLCAQTSQMRVSRVGIERERELSQSRAQARALRERTSLRERELLLSTARDCLDHPSFTALPYAMRLLEVIASSREHFPFNLDGTVPLHSETHMVLSRDGHLPTYFAKIFS